MNCSKVSFGNIYKTKDYKMANERNNLSNMQGKWGHALLLRGSDEWFVIDGKDAKEYREIFSSKAYDQERTLEFVRQREPFWAVFDLDA